MCGMIYLCKHKFFLLEVEEIGERQKQYFGFQQKQQQRGFQRHQVIRQKIIPKII